MIIFFGGSFNPPHIGHKIIANIAYDEFKPDKFIISATPKPPHKKNLDIVDTQKRKFFCKKTFADSFEISDIEEKLSEPSYTLKTLKYLKKLDDDILLLIGEDSLFNFKKWYKYEDILKISKLLVYPRLGFDTNNNITHIKLKAPIIEISSTEIRERVKKHKTIKGMVVESLEEDIKKIYTNT
jgi:nicotinate-nucleotide adenylyltransferase